MQQLRRAGAVMVLVAGLLLAPRGAGATDAVEVVRLAGTDRYGTAVAVARAAFPEGASRALLAGGEDFADALAAAGLAGLLDAPLLLTPRDRLAVSTRDELRRLAVGEVVLVGGRAALGPQVEAELVERGYTVRRIAGASRYDTAARVAREIGADAIAEVGGLRTVFVAGGAAFADALAAGPAAAGGPLPVLLTPRERLAEETADALGDLGVEQAVVVGGRAAVSAEAEAALRATGIVTRRVGGAERTDTARLLADFGRAALGWRDDRVALARGDGFADALAGGPHAGRLAMPLVLSQTAGALGAATRQWLAGQATTIRRIDALGGPAALSDAVLDEARGAATVVGPALTTDAVRHVPGEAVVVRLRNGSDAPLEFASPWTVQTADGTTVATRPWAPDETTLEPGGERHWSWAQAALPGDYVATVDTSAGRLRAAFQIGQYFTIGFDGRPEVTFVVYVTVPEAVEQMTREAGAEDKTLIVSGIVEGPADYNPAWSYRMGSDSIVLGEVFVEVCDAAPEHVEEHRDEWLGQRWCPWSSYVERIGRG